jgi:cell division protease FtsH
MSEKLGPVTFGKEDRQVFLGREMGRVKEYSEATALLIDQEIRGIIDWAMERAASLLSANMEKLTLLAEALLERETMTGTEVDELLGRRPGSGGEGATSDEGTAAPGNGSGSTDG